MLECGRTIAAPHGERNPAFMHAPYAAAMRWAMGIIVLLGGCHPAPPPRPRPVAQPFCTRTLGGAECFAEPYLLADHPAGLGDTPVRPRVPPKPWWQQVADHWR